MPNDFPYTRKIIDQTDETNEAEDLRLGYSLMHALAEAGDKFTEIGPGVWRHSSEGVTWVPLQEM